MPRIDFNNVSKQFGTVRVIEDFDAVVEDGEFLVLLGPSGCGKSTLLRMIAGLTPISSGELRFDGERANDCSPRQRNLAFVFQSYALYPHMTVRANIAFPLIMDRFRKWHHLPIVNTIMRWRMMRRPEVAQAVDRIADQLELAPLLDRRPASLSGGQRQRVALGRALVRNPALYLLDEPLSNLDAKLRTQMRSEISTLHAKVGKTFIYVTHDQVEAMTMATRIIVMDKGEIQQIDTPDRLYDAPANTFVARFVGSPPMNLIPVSIAPGRVSAKGVPEWAHGAPMPTAHQAIFGIRPEKLSIGAPGIGQMQARVAVIERLGAESVIGCSLASDDASLARLLERDLIFVRTTDNHGFRIGAACSLGYDPGDAIWFDEGSGKRIDTGPATSNPVA